MMIMLKRQSKKHWMNADDILINVLLNIQAVRAILITAIDLFFQTTPNAQRSSENLFCNDRVESDAELCGRVLREMNSEKD